MLQHNCSSAHCDTTNKISNILTHAHGHTEKASINGANSIPSGRGIISQALASPVASVQCTFARETAENCEKQLHDQRSFTLSIIIQWCILCMCV